MSKKKLEKKCVKGIHYGNFSFNSNDLTGVNEDSNLFKIPYGDFSNSFVVNKNELVMEMNLNDEKDDDQVLYEMRFNIPNGDAESLNEKMLGKLQIHPGSEEKVITSFEDLKFQIPRGKHSVTFLESSIKFHGGTFNYKAELKNLGKVYLLPKADSDTILFIFTFRKPLRQGTTKHSYFIIQFEKDENISIKLNLEPEELKEKYNDALMPEYKGESFDIFTKIFKIVTNISIILPGNFKSSDGEPSIQCVYKNMKGSLYFLQKSLIFLPKANIYFKFEEIKVVEFHRIGSNIQNKQFDLKIKRKDMDFSLIFLAIDKKDFECVEKFFSSKNIPTIIIKESFKQDDVDYQEEDEEEENSQQKNDKDNDDEDDESFIANDESSAFSGVEENGD